jgi:hydroxymethylpyrimidine/phosphomethylpyrimidine kinase
VTGDWFASIDRSKRWLTESLRHGEQLEVGGGHGPVSHFAGLWQRGGLETSATAEWWERIAQLRKATETDPFLVALADGTLGKDAFADYLAQDAHYLEGYAEVLARLAELAADPVEQVFWAAAAETCRTAETVLHRDWADQEPPAVAAVTRAYLDHLEAAVNSGYGPGVAAVLPCYWMYADIGNRLAVNASGHVYREWIDMYSDPVFEQATRTVRDIADRVAAGAGPEGREAMWRAFERAAGLEREFFAAALQASPRSSLLA